MCNIVVKDEEKTFFACWMRHDYSIVIFLHHFVLCIRFVMQVSTEWRFISINLHFQAPVDILIECFCGDSSHLVILKDNIKLYSKILFIDVMFDVIVMYHHHKVPLKVEITCNSLFNICAFAILTIRFGQK